MIVEIKSSNKKFTLALIIFIEFICFDIFLIILKEKAILTGCLFLALLLYLVIYSIYRLIRPETFLLINTEGIWTKKTNIISWSNLEAFSIEQRWTDFDYVIVFLRVRNRSRPVRINLSYSTVTNKKELEKLVDPLIQSGYFTLAK
jgi:hypothetical protein